MPPFGENEIHAVIAKIGYLDGTSDKAISIDSVKNIEFNIDGTISIVSNISGELSTPGSIDGTASATSSVDGVVSIPEIAEHEKYDGSYTITPSFEAQVLATRNKTMRNDLTVSSIQTYETSNPYGTTFII